MNIEQLRQMAISVFEYNGELDYVVAYEIGELDYHADLVDKPSDYYLTYDRDLDTELVPKSDMHNHIKAFEQDIITEYNKAVKNGMKI